MTGVPQVERVGLRLILSDRAVSTVVLLAFVVMLGAGIVLPILPLYARSFGVGYEDAGVLVSAYGFARLLCDLAAGLIVDRWGERRSASAGLAVVASSALLTGLAPNFALAVIFWAGAGAGSAVVFAAMYSHLLKVVPQDRMARTLSIFYGAFNGGVVAGGFLAGVIAYRLGIASPLFFSAGLAAFAGLLYLRFLPDAGGARESPPLSPRETLIERDIPVERPPRARLGEVLQRPGFVAVLAANLAYLWLIAAVFDTLVPLFAVDELEMSTVGIGVVFAVALATEFLVLYPAGALADRRGRKFVLVPSLVALALLTAVVGWAGSPLALGALMAVLGIATGFAGVPPAAMLADVTPERQSGTAVGVFRFCGDLGFALGPLAVGFAATTSGFRTAFVVAAAPVVLALVLALRAPETLRSASA